MSQDRVFIFVEGRGLDPYIYGQICGPICKAAARSYEIVIADRIAGGGGGKNILTLLFELLEKNKALVDRTARDSKLVMFYLDKDVDDIFGALRISPHVVYTRHYCIENHLFEEGGLVSSIALAGSVDVELIRARINDPTAWRIKTTRCWRDWVALCILAKKLSLAGPASYRLRDSQVNFPPDSEADGARLSAVTSHTSQMQAASGLQTSDFQVKLRAAYRLVDSIYRRTKADLIFKGKWYSVFALGELETASASRPYNRNGAPDRLMGSLVATTNFDAPWVEHFRGPLRSGLAVL
jgi:hypothetical protein